MCSELKITIKAAKEAGDVILKYYKSKYEIKDKSYHNPVTTADKEADETIKKILMNNFPDYGWLSEETVDSSERLLKEKVWVVDPLDGTKEFIEGIPNFVVSIGLVKEGNPILGILHPNDINNHGLLIGGSDFNCVSISLYILLVSDPPGPNLDLLSSP